MRKIISLYQRNYDGDRLVRDEVVPGAEWVFEGEGVATRKWDGTCCMVRGGKLFRRHVVKEGKKTPHLWEHWSGNPEQKSGHGWLPVTNHPSDQYHVEGLDNTPGLEDCTCELVGPRVQKGVEGFNRHILEPHGEVEQPDAPRDFEGLKAYLDGGGIEGIVWHHPDGRMVKIKAKDFGVAR
jgi:hypothetical protein